jgi:hypothetical protein
MDEKRVVSNWLRGKLTPLVNVQRCGLGSGVGSSAREPELCIYTWAGVIVQVHLVDEPLKGNRIRRILENATGVGTATLFIVDARMLPKPGERTLNNKWYQPLPALTGDQLYAYSVNSSAVIIQPVQFIEVSKTEVEASYGAPVGLEQLRYYRQTVKHNAVKGYWLLADFEPEVTTQFHFRQTKYEQYQTPPSGSAKRGDSKPLAERTQLDEYYSLFGLSRQASQEQVKAAFRRLAFQSHPDVSALPKHLAEERFKLISEAYEYIKNANNWP